jgi:hypothetical protein
MWCTFDEQAKQHDHFMKHLMLHSICYVIVLWLQVVGIKLYNKAQKI